MRASDGVSALVPTKKDGTERLARKEGRFAHFALGGFQCVWFMNFGPVPGSIDDAEVNSIVAWWRKKFGRLKQCDVADSVEGLPNLVQVHADLMAKKKAKAEAKRGSALAPDSVGRPASRLS